MVAPIFILNFLLECGQNYHIISCQLAGNKSNMVFQMQEIVHEY